MLPYPDRFRFKSAPTQASRLMFAWFLFLILMAILSASMLVTAIVQAAETEMNPDIRPRDATSSALVTCYPFDSIIPGGPLRYIVTAEKAE